MDLETGISERTQHEIDEKHLTFKSVLSMEIRNNDGYNRIYDALLFYKKLNGDIHTIHDITVFQDQIPRISRHNNNTTIFDYSVDKII